MISAQQLNAPDPQIPQSMLSLMGELVARDEQLRAKDVLIAQPASDTTFKQALIDKLTHGLAVLKRLKFAATSERFASTLVPEQKGLLEETLEADLAELQRELERQRGAGDDQSKDKTEKKTLKRTPPPPHRPRRDVAHEPTDTSCGCGQPMQSIGQDVAEKLDYQPGVFTVERRGRGKWVCRCCQKLVQAPAPAHVIDKGIHTAGLPTACVKMTWPEAYGVLKVIRCSHRARYGFHRPFSHLEKLCQFRSSDPAIARFQMRNPSKPLPTGGAGSLSCQWGSREMRSGAPDAQRLRRLMCSVCRAPSDYAGSRAPTSWNFIHMN